jgi:hypothetical protein
MTIDLLDDLKEYALGPTNEEWNCMSPQEREQLRSERRAREASPTFTVDEFHETLICSGGVELHGGRVAPRL